MTKGHLWQPFFNHELHKGCVVFLGAHCKYGIVQKIGQKTPIGFLHLVRGIEKLPHGFNTKTLPKAIWN